MAAADEGGMGAPAGTRRLRRVLAGIAVLLLVVLGGLIVMAHWRTKNYLSGLPKRLGVDIQQQSDSFTYSQSSKGKTLFTVHAAKEVQRKDGKIALHDVGIVLYGPTGQPTDRIHGADFAYDAKLQKMTASGEVYLDLVPPASEQRGLPAQDAEARMIHVKTIGLEFDQRMQTASTPGAVEFRTGSYSGSSVGASYDASNGMVVLGSAVHLSGLRAEKPVVLTASHAELDRKVNVISLAQARYVSADERGSQTAEALEAVIHIQQDGTPERVDADGGVRLVSGQQGTLESRRMALLLGPTGQPSDAHFSEDVRYTRSDGPNHASGHAAQMRITFDDMGRAQHAVISGGVGFAQRVLGGERELSAALLNVALSGGGSEPLLVRAADASGPDGARLRLVADSATGRSSTDVRAEKLVGRFGAGGTASLLTGLYGTGSTLVERVELDPRGKMLFRDTSAGDTLKVDFKPGEGGRSELTRAEQHGRVTTTRESLGKDGQSQVDHTRADAAVYDAGTNLVHMTGGVVLEDALNTLSADRVQVNRNTGDATADGAVHVSTVQQQAQGGRTQSGSAAREPLHVLAARAVEHHAAGLTEFFGDARGRARMWQGSSQVEAPELDLFQGNQTGNQVGNQTGKRLVAKGDGGTDVMPVRALLVRADGTGEAKPGQGLIRVTSREMVYTDSTRTVVFLGGVRAVDQTGTLTAQQATVWLAGSGLAGSGPVPAQQQIGAASSLMGGKVERIVATGSVLLEQPGRKATGETLVYMAADSSYRLTGTRALPPRVEDVARGSTTGAALRFRSGDDSVQVLGSEDAKTAGRVRSETRVRQ